MDDRAKEFARLAELNVRFLDQSSAFFDVKPYRAGDYNERTLLMHEIRREGIDL